MLGVEALDDIELTPRLNSRQCASVSAGSLIGEDRVAQCRS